ncbi:protein tyrosine phosphatase [Corynebacterium phocae]|uniref:Protein tyrosine phosphatase n=1 Tax=Corynebacterium phocae TaxID=161895 RepID=A0A1L7D3P5_9CORY|nr:low molecular weight phosphatase family protein [Corynebacterium phocae]APT92754.1 protein tyrosine phosphatase [Corynebacterium phocae]KAA8723065.1 low molecular weight phosphatase family protein [Corynebacterium phocae]
MTDSAAAQLTATTPSPSGPKVLYLCNSNRGKSQMAAALHKLRAPDWQVYSAGVKVAEPGNSGDVNREAAASLHEIGADMSDGTPTPVDPQLAAEMDYVVIVGGADYAGPAIRWEIEDPSVRGVEGKERLRQLRDDIDSRVQALIAEAT